MFNRQWSIENIRQGFQQFYMERGKYPTAEEIDSYPYLPSSRQIQRAFGGLVSLRRQLGLEIINYTTGDSRSKVGVMINRRGNLGEREIEQILIEHFGHHFVHTEKLIGKGKCRADFYVYTKNCSFAVDVFYAKNYRVLMNIINIKLLAYSEIGEELYLINLNETSDITEEAIAKYLSRRKKPLSKNIKLMNKTQFLTILKNYHRLRAL